MCPLLDGEVFTTRACTHTSVSRPVGRTLLSAVMMSCVQRLKVRPRPFLSAGGYNCTLSRQSPVQRRFSELWFNLTSLWTQRRTKWLPLFIVVPYLFCYNKPYLFCSDFTNSMRTVNVRGHAWDKSLKQDQWGWLSQGGCKFPLWPFSLKRMKSEQLSKPFSDAQLIEASIFIF